MVRDAELHFWVVVVTSSVDLEMAGSRHEITGLTKVVRQGENDKEHLCWKERKTTLLLGLVGQNIISFLGAFNINVWTVSFQPSQTGHGQVLVLPKAYTSKPIDTIYIQ